MEPGREIVWWAPDDPFLGARTWSAWSYRVVREGEDSRLLMRVDVAAMGATSFLVMLLLPLIDSIMASKQLRNLKQRIERHGIRTEDVGNPETGKRDQYQLHHVIYASGDVARWIFARYSTRAFLTRFEVDRSSASAAAFTLVRTAGGRLTVNSRCRWVCCLFMPTPIYTYHVTTYA